MFESKSCMHRDYQANMPIRLYQFYDHVEIMNAGGLYGEARPENSRPSMTIVIQS